MLRIPARVHAPFVPNRRLLIAAILVATGPVTATRVAGADTLRLTGVVRDFQAVHPDFDVTPFGGFGHFAGNVSTTLRADGRPQFVSGVAGGYQVATEWHDKDGRMIAPNVYRGGGELDACGDAIMDGPGARGVASNGGIDSEATYNTWFRDIPGVNQSVPHTIELARDGAGAWTYTTEAFHPIDGRAFGNEDQPHNYLFTYHFKAEFIYSECWAQFIRIEGGDGAWVFINDSLVLDLGGVAAGETQQFALDRLHLVNGETYTLDLFLAQRRQADTRFVLKTTLDLSTANFVPTVSAMFD